MTEIPVTCDLKVGAVEDEEVKGVPTLSETTLCVAHILPHVELVAEISEYPVWDGAIDCDSLPPVPGQSAIASILDSLASGGSLHPGRGHSPVPWGVARSCETISPS